MRILNIIGVQNQLPISFGTASVYNKILKVRNSPNKHTKFQSISCYTLKAPKSDSKIAFVGNYVYLMINSIPFVHYS